MVRDIKNVAASVHARLRNESRKTGTELQVLLSHYVLERLLYRLSVSSHRDGFILKGALLFALWVDSPLRPTRDLDLIGVEVSQPDELTTAFREIMTLEVPDDGVVFDTDGIQAAAIREAVGYGGVRVRTQARLGNARIPVQIDVGFGDVVIPPATEVAFRRFLTRRPQRSVPIRGKPSWRRSSRPSCQLAATTVGCRISTIFGPCQVDLLSMDQH